MNVHEVKSIETKSILSRLKSKDNYWGIAYNMNLYRGCQHGCIYCDTRSSCYGVGDISHISVKKNAWNYWIMNWERNVEKQPLAQVQ